MNSCKAARPRHKALRVQADVPHTFGTLLIPLAIVLVVWGIFLVERAIADPLSSDIDVILFGSVVLACGLLLTANLLRAARVSAILQMQERTTSTEQPKPHRMVRRSSIPESPPVPQRPSQHAYVDDVRISL